MVKEYKFEIPDCHPSINQWHGRHWSHKEYLKGIWYKMVMACAKKAKVPKINQPVEIHIDYFNPRHIDLDNLTPKFILDGLKGIVILDDNPNIVKKISWTFTKDKNKRSIVLIRLVD